ncbi:MAG: RluA family pseudouridine synthase [Patescibacteria group bacterium]|jgi:23S rRNA pseudouridine1911/1915/1917 synthase
MKHNIDITSSGQRLDIFLLGKMPGLSRSKIQKKIKEGGVKVNGKTVAPHYFLKAGDVVDLSGRKNTKASEEKLIEKKRVPAKKIPKIQLDKIVIGETDEFLIINKPSGIAVHGQPGDDPKIKASLIDIVAKKYPAIKKIGDDPCRPGVVHRLDKEVSGVMVIAKSQASFENLKRQFMEREVKKTYVALVYGRIEKDEGVIDFPIERSREGKMAARPANQPGKIAVTHFKVIKRYINYTLLEARPKTGRTHQIRAHLAAYGNPIVGDNLYSTKDSREKNKKLDLGRIFLAAIELSIKNLSGEELTFRAGLPKKLKELLEIIK